MSDKKPLTDNERERLIVQYIASVERGDLETVGEILDRACEDAELEKMILAAIDAAYGELLLLDECDRSGIEEIAGL